MVDEGDIKLADMRSSWAGAMGLTQFLPSDIFATASISMATAARHLDVGAGRARVGGQATCRQRLAARPSRGRSRCARRATSIAPSGFRKTPSRSANGCAAASSPAYGRKLRPRELAEPASLLQPAGLYGPSFLTPKNYFVIKEYNFSDLYVLFVGHLSDRMPATPPFETPWATVQMPTAQVERMQRRLTERGFYSDKIDGKAGMKTRAALGAYQNPAQARL